MSIIARFNVSSEINYCRNFFIAIICYYNFAVNVHLLHFLSKINL